MVEDSVNSVYLWYPRGRQVGTWPWGEGEGLGYWNNLWSLAIYRFSFPGRQPLPLQGSQCSQDLELPLWEHAPWVKTTILASMSSNLSWMGQKGKWNSGGTGETIIFFQKNSQGKIHIWSSTIIVFYPKKLLCFNPTDCEPYGCPGFLLCIGSPQAEDSNTSEIGCFGALFL